MPSDEYATFTGGALKLKGAKVKKHKKKKDSKGGSDLEKALSTGEPSARRSGSRDVDQRAVSEDRDRVDKEARRSVSRGLSQDRDEEDGNDDPLRYKTEAERRFYEARRKKLLEMSESAAARPELLKTHKQRVEELNTYLSKLSEHHDMPKIGPG